MKTRKLLLMLAAITALMTGCASSEADDAKRLQHGESVDMSTLHGRKIAFISYCRGCGPDGDQMTLLFSDGSRLVLGAKYEIRARVEGPDPFSMGEIDWPLPDTDVVAYEDTDTKIGEHYINKIRRNGRD